MTQVLPFSTIQLIAINYMLAVTGRTVSSSATNQLVLQCNLIYPYVISFGRMFNWSIAVSSNDGNEAI